MPKLETLSIDLLRLDGGTQARLKTNEDVVDDYADVITAEAGEWPFDPIDVFHDGADYFVADGFHRTLSAIRVKRSSIPCRVHQGTAKDAKIFGMTANDTHGLRMSREDKRACVEWLLDNGANMTQEEISEKAGVARRTVSRIVADRKPQPENVPMAQSTISSKNSSTPPKLTDAEKLKKQKEKAASAAKKKAASDAAKAKKKAEANAAREKKKADAAAAKEKAKADAKAAKEKAKEDAKAAKMAALPADEQARLIKSALQQHIDRAVRLVDDLHRVRKNQAKRVLVVKLLQDAGLNLW